MLDHVNIRVANYDLSKKFYQAALAPLGYTPAMEVASGAGFSREYYHPNYYGAFVLDPDGYNIEAVCHKAE